MNGARRTNNFDFIRFASATAVVVSHSYALAGARDPFGDLTTYANAGSLGVYVFFCVSGFLVQRSWESDPHALRFLARRALRIVPALAVVTLLSVFLLGPAVSGASLAEYFTDPTTFAYLANASVFRIQYHLPGVFLDNPIPRAVNGSLWSLPIEGVMYVGLAAIGRASGAHLRLVVPPVIAALLVADHWLWRGPAPGPVVVAGLDLRYVATCGVYFWIAAAVALFRGARPFGPGFIAAIVVLAAALRGSPLLKYVYFAGLPCLVSSLAFASRLPLAGFGRYGDFSYGLYIFAFPIQQLVACQSASPPSVGTILAFSFPVALLCAILSWHALEKHALRWKPARRSA